MSNVNVVCHVKLMFMIESFKRMNVVLLECIVMNKMNSPSGLQL